MTMTMNAQIRALIRHMSSLEPLSKILHLVLIHRNNLFSAAIHRVLLEHPALPFLFTNAP